MSAVAGTVPTQGIVVGEATTAKKRGHRGDLGDGTPGSRLKARWKAAKSKVSFRSWLRAELKTKGPAHVDSMDIVTWLDSKKPHGGPATLSDRQARRERIAVLNSNRQAKSAKGKMQVPKKDSRGGR